MKKSIKISLILLLLLACVIVSFNSLFGFLIKTQIKRITNNGITLDYESSRARILLGKIEFREATLRFKDISIDGSSSIFIETVSFEKFAITQLNLKALIFDRSFNVKKILLQSPRVDFLKDTIISRKDLFRKVITPDVISTKSQSAPFSFEIGELEIDHGSFQMTEADKNDIKLGRINLKLSNIGMDDMRALNGEDADLNANFNIRLGLYEIQKKLAGNSEVYLDSLIYKKDKRLVEAGGIQLTRLETSTAYGESELSLFTDIVSIHGFSLSHFLSSQDLKFNRVSVSNTKIFEEGHYFTERHSSDKKTTSTSQHFSSLINAFIVDTLHIHNFNYHLEDTSTDSINFVKHLNFWLYGIQVDSNFISKREYLRPIEKSKLLSGPIKMHMPENGFDMQCDSMMYSGPKKEQIFLGLNIRIYSPLFSDEPDQPTLEFATDSLRISGLDEKEWLDSAVVELSLHLENPRICGVDLRFGKSKKKSRPDLLPDKIIFNEINLVNGQIHLEGVSNEIIDTKSLNIKMNAFEVNPGNDQHKPSFDWQHLFCSIGKTNVKLPNQIRIQMDGGIIENNTHDFDGLFFLKINPAPNTNKTDTIRFSVGEITIEEFDILGFLNAKRLSIQRLDISSPTYFQYSSIKEKKTQDQGSFSPILLYRQLNRQLPEYFSSINIQKLTTTEADAMYKMEQDNLVYHSKGSTVMENIHFDPSQPEGILPEFIIDKYEFCIRDATVVSDKMKFITESICYNSDEDVLTIVKSKANSRTENSEFQNAESMQYAIALPRITLSSPDFTPLSGGPVSFSIIHLVDPEIRIQIPSNEEKLKKVSPSDFKILPFTFLDDGVILENGKLEIGIAGKEGNTNISIQQINVDIHEMFKIIGAAEHHGLNKNLLSYLNFHLKDIAVKGPGMRGMIGNIDYDKRSGILSIQPIQQELFSKNDAPYFSNTFRIPEITIENPDLVLDNEIIQGLGAQNLLIPTVNVALSSTKKDESIDSSRVKASANNLSLRKLLGNIDYFHIDSTMIGDIGVTAHTLINNDTQTFNIERISLLIDKLRIDSSHFDIREKRIAKDIIVRLHDKELITADSLYRMKINDITYYYSRDKIVVDSFALIPRFEREAFFKKAEFQTDRMQIKLKRAVAEGFDLLSFIEDKKVQVSKLSIDEIKLMDHRNKHYPRKENDFKLLPKQSLFNIPFGLNIDTVKVDRSFLLYGEYVDKSPKPGEVFFTNFNASILNVSNVIKPGKQSNNLLAMVEADIMNEAKMDIEITIPLIDKADYFWFRGSVEETDLRHFNSMTENLFGISILRGKGGVNIPLITANYTHSKGTLKFEYKRLKLALYNRDKAHLSRGMASGLIDFMMNGVLIKSNNPTFLGKTRTGDVYFERNDQRSFFNYLWKSVQSGLTTTMGFYNKDLREEKRERKEEEKVDRKGEKENEN